MSNLSREEKLALVDVRLGSLDRQLTDEQLDFILHPIETPCYLKACPGSGKTEVVGIKAAFEVSSWKKRFSGFAVLSFTKNAAKEIANRIKMCGTPEALMHPHFVGTIDSWLHGYVLQPFAHKAGGYAGKNSDKSFRLIDNEDKYDFLTGFKTNLSGPPTHKDAWVNEYYFECFEPYNIQSLNRQLDLSSDSLPLQILRDNKKRFFKAGLATYPDAEFLCHAFLKNNSSILKKLVKRFPIVIIDECQDLSSNQLEILSLLKSEGCVIHFVGDNNQSIYEFKKVYVEKINDYIANNNMTVRLLTRNFRSNQSIVNVSLGLELKNTGLPSNTIVGNEYHVAEKACILWEYSTSELAALPQKFIDHVHSVNSFITVPKDRIDLTKCGILARAHATLSNFKSHPNSELSKIELFANALCCWANNPRTGKDMQNSLQQIGKAVSLLIYAGNGNHQHQYCPDSYSTIEWRKLLCKLIMLASEEGQWIYPFLDQTWSNWTARLKIFLEQFWSHFLSPTYNWKSVKARIKAPKGLANKKVIQTLKASENYYSEKIRMTTFHDVKGESLDAVLVISSKHRKSKGGHYEQWLNTDVNQREYVRFAYVASSRPRHLLIWAIPKVKNNVMISEILKLGFEFV